VVPAAATRRLAEALPHGAVEIFDGVGHGTFRQATERAFGRVRRFLEETRSHRS
jgi:pimeloyl-ACP methyl ester carboxylesterase